MPAAEGAQEITDAYLPNVPEIVRCISNSIATLTAQFTVGYTAYMANEVRVNPAKYRNQDGKISVRKIGKGFYDAAKTFLKFDLTYAGLKTGLQSLFLALKKDPWRASGIADSIALPAWYSIAIPLGLNGGLIETKQTKEWAKEKTEKSL